MTNKLKENKQTQNQTNSINQIQQKIDKYFTEQINSLKQAPISQSLYLQRIGPHIRHSYNFIENFLNQFESGQIDYETRQRDSQKSTVISASKDVGLDYLQKRINQLTQDNLEDKILQVRTDFGTTLSNTANELTTIASHTMHHFGIIGEILNNNKVELPKYFGYAPSTITYETKK